MRDLNKLALQNNLSRRSHSYSWDKDGYLTVTTSIAVIEPIPREEIYQHVFKCTKAETNLYIQMAREIATEAFLALGEEKEAPVVALVKPEAKPLVDGMIDSAALPHIAKGLLARGQITIPPMGAIPAEKPKKKRASRKKKEVVAVAEPVAEEAPIHIAAEVAAPDDDGLGDLEEAKPTVVVNYKKGDKVHGKFLGALLANAYGKEWQKDEKVKSIVRGLVAAIKDVVPVVDSEGEMLESFPVFVAEYLRKAA